MFRRSLALLLCLSAIWGSSFLFIKLGVDELEPSAVALGRLVVGAAILLPVAAGRFGLLQLPSEASPTKTALATDVTRLRTAGGRA